MCGGGEGVLSVLSLSCGVNSPQLSAHPLTGIAPTVVPCSVSARHHRLPVMFTCRGVRVLYVRTHAQTMTSSYVRAVTDQHLMCTKIPDVT